MSKIESTDVLVIGGGLAGERCAMEAAAAGHEVTIISLVPPRRSHSCAAPGGMQVPGLALSLTSDAAVSTKNSRSASVNLTLSQSIMTFSKDQCPLL